MLLQLARWRKKQGEVVDRTLIERNIFKAKQLAAFKSKCTPLDALKIIYHNVAFFS